MPRNRTPLGRLLQERRDQRGWSRARAGELAGLKATTIQTWESGKVVKPPIHDVLRLARVLQISMEEIERAVLADVAEPEPPPNGLSLLDQALGALGWTESEAADALGISTLRVAALRTGDEQLTVLEVVTLSALIALSRGGAPPGQVAQELARLRERPVGS